MLFIACHFIWVLFLGHSARWEEAANAVMSVRPLMMLQGFDKDTKQCLQKGASSLITPQKQGSLSFFKSFPLKLVCIKKNLESQTQIKFFSVFLQHVDLPHTKLMSGKDILYSSLPSREKQKGYFITDSLP